LPDITLIDRESCWAKAWPAEEASGYWVQHGDYREATKFFPYTLSKEIPTPLPDMVWLWLRECHRYRPCKLPCLT